MATGPTIDCMTASEASVSTAETIVAISTPPGRGGIGIVRLSGPQSVAVAMRLVRLRGSFGHGSLEHARACLADVLEGDPEGDPVGNADEADDAVGAQKDSSSSDAGQTVAAQSWSRMDEALVTYFAAPRSYTGEDLVEIAAHGSPVVLEHLVRRAMLLGAQLAAPGEFTQRAFLSGRMDLTQAEAVRDLIEAQTLAQARLAASQMGGALSARVQPIKQELLELIALLEAGIDFAEDDLEVAPAEEILRRMDAVAEPLQALAATFRHGRVLHDGLTLAIVGRPNAGKSSLFNALVERDRAIVTPIPGTTRDLISERIALGGIPLELVDTAGLRESTDAVERIGVERSRTALADAALVLLVVDATAGLHAEDRKLLAALEQRAAILVWNKCDLQPEIQSDALPPGMVAIATSALTGQGLADLRAAIVRLATGGAAAEPGMLTTLRHRQTVSDAGQAMADARKAAETDTPHEMVLLDLYRALWALDALTGQTTTDDVLHRIFSSFCIGK